jgi:hypothetical protein
MPDDNHKTNPQGTPGSAERSRREGGAQQGVQDRAKQYEDAQPPSGDVRGSRRREGRDEPPAHSNRRGDSPWMGGG